MATIFSHALVAGVAPYIMGRVNKKLIFLCILCAIFPDIDVLAFKLGIPYEHPLGHRGFTHSILFAVVFPIMLIYFFYKNISLKMKVGHYFLFLFCISSHTFLDALTNGGLGVGLFIPFENSRYFAPITPIQVSPIGRYFFSQAGLLTIVSECKYIVAPLMILVGGRMILNKLTIKVNK